ncbi:efflux RND transporter periplasmic adaptor subunit [Petrimonas sp.]|uniref:efflux RND transporter periplasmic adaptor subunit n=1 Tax=Petrimonas sp. TaxID=2023866 RepID=UPI003F514C89
MQLYKHFFWGVLLVATLFSCHNKKSDNETGLSAEDSALVIISNRQFEAMQMEFGALRETQFSESVKVNGHVISSVKGQAQVTSRISGTIRNISRELGDFIPAGSVLCTIESNDFIVLQQDFATVSNQFNEARNTYERLQSLYRDSISSRKDFIAAESSYKSLSAQYNGMKQRLSLLNVNPTQIENGNFYPTLEVRSPIGGFITQINCMIGEYVTPEKMLMTIVNTNQLYLQLDVYEKDIAQLAVGQNVQFYNPNNPSEKFTAKLTKIGKAIDPEKKTILCTAQIDPTSVNFVNNMYIEADVSVKEYTAKGLPEDALETSPDGTYRIYLLEKKSGENIYLNPVSVTTGLKSSDLVEIKTPLPTQEILLKGVYSLPAVE